MKKIRLIQKTDQKNFEESGQSLMEMAISLIIVLLLLAGVVDLGRAFFNLVALRDAAQEGAAYGSVCPNDVIGIYDRVRNSASNSVLTDPSLVEVQCFFIEEESGFEAACDSASLDPQPGMAIRVVTRYDNFRLTMPFIGAAVGSQTIPLRGEILDTILTDSLTSCGP